MDQDTKQKLSKYLVKPLLYGAAGAVASAIVTSGTDFYVNVMGRPMNALWFIGGACGVSSIVSDVAYDYVLPYLPLSEISKTKASLINLGLNGASVYGILVLTRTTDMSNVLVPLGIRAASAVVGEYVYQNYADPWIITL